MELHPGLIVLRESGLTRDEQWNRIRRVILHILKSSDDDFLLNKLVARSSLRTNGKFVRFLNPDRTIPASTKDGDGRFSPVENVTLGLLPFNQFTLCIDCDLSHRPRRNA